MISLATSPARLPGESFECYQERREAINRGLKKYLKGRLVWSSVKFVPQVIPHVTDDGIETRTVLVKAKDMGTFRYSVGTRQMVRQARLKARREAA